MAKKKESTAKKVGRFVTDELLGVDDAKRAFNKAKKGDIKGAVKSAATGALELGTTATAVGKGGILAAKIGAKTVGKKAVEKASTDIGQAAGRKVAEKIKPGKISTEGKKFVKKVEGDVKVTGKSGSTGVSKNSAKVSGTTPKPSTNQVLGRMKADTTKRVKAIVSTAASAKEGSAPIVKKALGDISAKRLAQGAVIQKGAVKLTEKDKKKKGK